MSFSPLSNILQVSRNGRAMIQVDRFYTSCPTLPLTCRGRYAQTGVQGSNPWVLQSSSSVTEHRREVAPCALLATVQRQRRSQGDPGRQKQAREPWGSAPRRPYFLQKLLSWSPWQDEQGGQAGKPEKDLVLTSLLLCRQRMKGSSSELQPTPALRTSLGNERTAFRSHPWATALGTTSQGTLRLPHSCPLTRCKSK